MSTESPVEKQTPWSVIIVIVLLVIALVAWLLMDKDDNIEPQVIAPPIVEVIDEPEPVVIDQPEVVVPEEAPSTEIETLLPEPVAKPELPTLDKSDALMVEKLPAITWRKELLKLVVTDDLIRRFVVFTDNFAKGNLSYDNSPLVSPQDKFFANETVDNGNQVQWQWDEASTRRFGAYVDLLRSMDSEVLVSTYFDVKPLIDQAYQELGYPDDNFTDVLQSSISRVLDIHVPETMPELTRPSVMYKYQDADFESLDAADKLLLRLGKENILVIKSVLLEINDKISRAEQAQ